MSKTVDAWRKIIQGLVPNVTLSAQIVGGNLVIESFQSLQGLKNLLQSASPETIQQALSWELRAEGQEGVSVDDIELLTKAHGPVVDDVLDAISNKPNEALFEEALYQAFIKKMDGGFKLLYTEDAQGRLCIKIDVSAFPDKHRHSMSHIYLDSFREWFSGLGSGEILQCLGSTLGGNNSEAVLQASSETDSEKWQVYKDALLRYDEASGQITFDMPLLKEIMLPPRVHQKLISGDGDGSVQTKHQLSVNIQHLFNFISRSKDWVIVPSESEVEEKGVPILFAKPLEKCASRIQVLLYLDGSISLRVQGGEEAVKAYDQSIKDLIDGLYRAFPARQSDLVIQYRTFSDSVSSLELLDEHATASPERGVSWGSAGQTALYSVIRTANGDISKVSTEALGELLDKHATASLKGGVHWCPAGQTALYSVIRAANGDISKVSPKDIAVMVLITDGVNTVPTAEPEQEDLEAMQKFNGNAYVIGQGEIYDRSLCDKLALWSGGQHVHVDQMHEMMQNLSSLDKVFSFFEVTLTENGEMKTMPIRISNEELLQELPALEQGQTVTINGTVLTAHQCAAPEALSESSGTDRTDGELDTSIDGQGLFKGDKTPSGPGCSVM